MRAAMKIRTYSELALFESFLGRYEYLALQGEVAYSTFGFDRYLNQLFYRSRQWRQLRNDIIVRDSGCDLGMDDYLIYDRPVIHHMNPMTVENIKHGDDEILNPEYLITTTHRTHNAIHYGDASLLPQKYVARRPGDTRLWPSRVNPQGAF